MSNQLLERWIGKTLRETTLRANSLLITIYGDAIAPHGGAVLLGSLIRLVSPLGLNDRLVRTTVFRLVQEDWLASTPVGRRSLYRLTTAGQRRISHAYRRIYDIPHSTWDGQWQLAIIPEGTLAPKEREVLRKDLLWEGYGAIAPGVLALPAAGDRNLDDLLEATGAREKLVLFTAHSVDGLISAPLRSVVQQCWHLDSLAQDYEHFIERFSPILKALETIHEQNPVQSFVLRTLLIHEFRRVQLRDPQLPEALLEKAWPGHTARQLCRDIYARTLQASEQYLHDTLETADGRLPAAEKSLFGRFGGLKED